MKFFMIVLSLMSCAFWSSVELTSDAEGESYQNCLDHKGKEVSHGDRFFPLGSDPCTQCTCLNGKPQMCIAVFCSPPENCKQYHALSDKCCEFVCLDRDFPNKASGNGTYPGKDDTDSLSTTNLGLRLVASTVTSFLILALLLFMIHRLRQRRLLLMIRRFHARRMDNGNAHLSRRFSEDDDGSVGYFVGHDQLDFSRYDEPPPPYTLWKPPEMYIPPGEAPPPYDLSVQLTAPYTSSECFRYAPAEQVELQHQAIISVHVENQESSTRENASTSEAATASNTAENIPVANCSICTAVDIELNNMANSTGGAVLPPDIQYEESGNYMQNASNAVNTLESESTAIHEEDTNNINMPSTSTACNDNSVPTTSSCTCNLVTRKGRSKRHSCSDTTENSAPRVGSSRNSQDKRYSVYPINSNQENNNLYPDPTVWCGEASESSSSSSPTYDQPTLSPSTSDSSSADADFAKNANAKQTSTNSASLRTVSNRTVYSSREPTYENTSRLRELQDETAKAPHFQKTLSNLKKFSLIKRKKKKRRMERPSEISCSFVCQAIPDNLHTAHQAVFEDGIDLTNRSTTDNMGHPLEAINPHIGHKLASSGLGQHSRPTNISISSQGYQQGSRRSDGTSHHNYLSYGDVPCCSSVVTVSGGTIETNCPACCNSSSPDSICECHRGQSEVHATQSSRSLTRQGISRSGSICSETGERRHHRSAGSSPTTLRSSRAFENSNSRFSDARYASSSHIIVTDRTNGRHGYQSQASDDGTIRHIPVWLVNSMSGTTRRDYDVPSIHSSAMRRSASGCFGEGSRSVGDISSPLDFRDSMMSSGSSWEACSHL